MTVSSATSKVVHLGTGSSTVFPFAFKVFDAAHLQVIRTDADGVETVLDAGFTVSLNANQETTPGGSVGYTPAIASGTKLTLLRVVPYTQTTDIKNQGGYYPEVLERSLDLLEMQAQQLAEEAARAVKVGASSSVDPSDLLDELQADVLAAAGSAAAAAQSLMDAESAAVAAAVSEAAAAGYAASIDPSQFAPKASPALTGTPTAPTAAADTSTTQLATTAYVRGQVSATNPAMNGVAAPGMSARFARSDHVHPVDTSRQAQNADLGKIANAAAWTAYTPTVTAGSGTITTASATARYIQLGKTVIGQAKLVVTTNGTGAVDLRFTLPVSGKAGTDQQVGTFTQTTVSATTGTVIVISSLVTHGLVKKHDGTYPGVSGGEYLVTFTYEVS